LWKKDIITLFFTLSRCQTWGDSQLCSHVRAFVRGPLAPFLNPLPRSFLTSQRGFISAKLALGYAAFSSVYIRSPTAVMIHSTLYVWEFPSDCPAETGSLAKEFVSFVLKRYFCLEHAALEGYRRRYFLL